MIIGTIYLLSVLFGGGFIDAFFVGQLEPGVKKYVVDKEVRKEILSELKITKKAIKEFNKQRKVQLKQYKQINTSRATTWQELNNFYVELHNDRLLFQDKMIDDRIALVKQIKTNEWSAIIALSEESIDKRKEKAQKKADKNKKKDVINEKNNYVRKETKPFKRTRESIDKTVANIEKQQRMIAGLDDLVDSFNDMNRQIRTINVEENSTIKNQHASKEGLILISEKMNTVRQDAFNKLINMHMSIKNNTSEDEWDSVIKAFNKDLTLSIR